MYVQIIQNVDRWQFAWPFTFKSTDGYLLLNKSSDSILNKRDRLYEIGSSTDLVTEHTETNGIQKVSFGGKFMSCTTTTTAKKKSWVGSVCLEVISVFSSIPFFPRVSNALNKIRYSMLCFSMLCLAMRRSLSLSDESSDNFQNRLRKAEN